MNYHQNRIRYVVSITDIWEYRMMSVEYWMRFEFISRKISIYLIKLSLSKRSYLGSNKRKYHWIRWETLFKSKNRIEWQYLWRVIRRICRLDRGRLRILLKKLWNLLKNSSNNQSISSPTNILSKSTLRYHRFSIADTINAYNS